MSSKQIDPVSGGVPIEPVVREWFNRTLSERTAEGILTYGMPLASNNGRDAFQDALEELVDAVQYVTQARIERATIERLSEMRRAALHGHLVTPCRSYRYGLDMMATTCGYCHTYWEVGDGEPEYHKPACLVAPEASLYLLAQLSAEATP